MCFSNLIQILPTTHAVKTTDKIEGLASTIHQAKPKIEYSKQDLITVRHNNVNLTVLPAGTISTIRRLKINKRKLAKPSIGYNSNKLESTFATYARFKQ